MFRINILPQSSGYESKETQQEESEKLKYNTLMNIFTLKRVLCPYSTTKGDLERQNSKVPRRTIAMKRAGKQTQFGQRVTRLFCKR
jgi:hypothetical protein